MTFVCSSVASAVRKSVSSSCALLPMLMSLPRPRWRAAARSRIAVSSAPDCEITEMPPAFGMWLAKDAFIAWSVLITPRQLGPTSLTPRAVHRRSISRSISAPSSSTSLKPAVMTTIALAPPWMASSTAAWTIFVGTAITPSSIGLPYAFRSGKHGRPRISSAVGLTGTIAPPKPPSLRLATTS
jgi:hypothetical protein